MKKEARHIPFSRAGELVHVEIVAPGADSCVTDLEVPMTGNSNVRRHLKTSTRSVHHERTIAAMLMTRKLDALDSGGQGG